MPSRRCNESRENRGQTPISTTPAKDITRSINKHTENNSEVTETREALALPTPRCYVTDQVFFGR
jgi:hypothetical protein